LAEEPRSVLKVREQAPQAKTEYGGFRSGRGLVSSATSATGFKLTKGHLDVDRLAVA
jgi:hypothetical protein